MSGSVSNPSNAGTSVLSLNGDQSLRMSPLERIVAMACAHAVSPPQRRSQASCGYLLVATSRRGEAMRQRGTKCLLERAMYEHLETGLGGIRQKRKSMFLRRHAWLRLHEG